MGVGGVEDLCIHSAKLIKDEEALDQNKFNLVQFLNFII